MFAVITILFLMTSILAFISDKLPKKVSIIALFVMGTIMVTMSTFKDIHTTADAENYVDYFNNNDDPLIELMTEPTFIYLSRILIALGLDIVVLFFIFAMITVPLKLYVINKLTPYVFTALMIYIPVYYPLQEIVQIRAGAAAAFLLLSLYFCCKKKTLYAIGALIVGTLFHYSCMVFLPVLCIGNRNLALWFRILLAMVVPVGFLMYFRQMDLFMFLPSSIVEGKIDFYKESAETGSKFSEYILPYKNLYLLAKCALLYFCLYFYNSIKLDTKYLNIVLVMLAASIFVNLSMATLPVFAGRIGDLYGMTDCIAFTYLLSFIKPSWVVKSIICFMGFYMIVFNYIFAGFVV